jgi:hypothetical protein
VQEGWARLLGGRPRRSADVAGWSSSVNQCHTGGSGVPAPSAGGAASISAAKAADDPGSTWRDISTAGGAQWAR